MSTELVSDGGDHDAHHATDAQHPLEIDGALADVTVPDADAAVDAGVDAEIEVDASTDAMTTDAVVEVDAYVPPPRYEGACQTDHDCELDEVCLRSEGLFVTHSYCAQTCASSDDCDKGPVGADPPVCTGSGRCRLPCDAVLGSGCPVAMVCQDLLLILPGNEGSCAFQE